MTEGARPQKTPLHVYLDDWGIEGFWEPWHGHRTAVGEEQWKIAIALCRLMNSMPVEDRCAALARSSGYVE